MGTSVLIVIDVDGITVTAELNISQPTRSSANRTRLTYARVRAPVF